jgi:NADPH:quinone reductase-like Zn-dependent oxidoreductase
MKAVVLTGYGDVDKLELRELPAPRVGPGELSVRVSGASVNPVDWKIRRGELRGAMPIELPVILGRDASGEVIEAGPGARGFPIGARVMGHVQGAYGERVVASAESWAIVPPALDLIDAAAIPLVGLTGSQLIDAVDPSPGQTLLVTGATGSVGRVAVFTARSRGAQIWAGVRRTQKRDAAQLGVDVDHVVALDDDRELDALPQFDAIADTVGGDTMQKLLSHVRRGGTIGSVLGKPPGAEERGLVVRAIFSHPDPVRLAELGRAVAEHRLAIPISRRFPLAQVRAAHQFAERGAGGKVILVV